MSGRDDRTRRGPLPPRRRFAGGLGGGLAALAGLGGRAPSHAADPGAVRPGGDAPTPDGRGPAQVPPLDAPTAAAPGDAGWRHQPLAGVARANAFDLEPDGPRRVLRIRSDASASTWLAPLDVDLARSPRLRWRWKVSRALPGSDLASRAGDDYAARLYVLFDLPFERLAFADRMKIRAARAFAGVDVPTAALCYVWGSRQPAGASGWSPYTDRVRMLVVDSGDARAGRWQTVERDVVRDWADAFGGVPPRVSGLALGADTDNTGERVEAWFDEVRFG